jgi:dipeptidyl aminopeptidase/acylaminoacyl peptidase
MVQLGERFALVVQLPSPVSLRSMPTARIWKVLLQNTVAGAAQFHDQILDWTPDEPDTVLIAIDEDRNGYPSVYELNVNNGRKTLRERESVPIRRFQTDGRGNVRLGHGYSNSGEIQYFARLEGEKTWRRRLKMKPYSFDDDVLEPIAIAKGKNMAYAVGYYEGRSALWEMDLTDQREPQLVFSHPHVDVETAVLASDGRLLGIWYEEDRPYLLYVDDAIQALMKNVNNLNPGTFNSIVDYNRNETKLVIRTMSDVDAGTYSILNRADNVMTQLGTAYPELAKAELGRMRPIVYKAQDGTEIPGYLTVPPGKRAEKLPLIVMPHGGPASRDSWEFDFLRLFLADRGYAVLQMNFRGSTGYGRKWFADAHQDWGGLTYSDITDATRWAIAQGIADPKRVAIVGWSFGGYAALLGAVRNSDLYRCAASIAGVSDLKHLLRESRFFSNYKFVREQIGKNDAKLEQDSPLRHADKISIPVLLVHGDKDYQVEDDHSKRMASALARANKPHRAVFIKGGTHSLLRESERMTLLTELENFLAENLAAEPSIPEPSGGE